MNPSALSDRLSAFYGSFVERYAPALQEPAVQRNALIIALVVAGVVVVALVAGIAFLPAKRKIVRKRVVRRVRRRVSGRPSPAAAVPSVSASPASTTEASKPHVVGSAAGVVTVWVLAGVLVLVSLAAFYLVTGTDRYCGETCHGGKPRVLAAMEAPHADCTVCHERGPISGSISRIRMTVVQATLDTSAAPDTASTPVDADRCLRCHRTVATTTVTTARGLIVSHKEILAGGRTCSDCHKDVGHGKTAAIAGGMSRCMSCHDGVTAAFACETCHVGGSPIAVASQSTKAGSAFDYRPAVRVANRDCARCHGAEKRCRDCHNGLVLPHPAEFVEGGHARMAAFGGKVKCVKCHTLAWCGNGKCHNGFSAHDMATWPRRHQSGSSNACGSCHIGWSGEGDFCKVCH